MTSARKTPLLKQDEPNIMKNVCRFCLSTDDEINRTSKWSRLEVGNLYREVTGNELIDLKLITNEGYCNACLVRLRHSAESLRMFKEAERVWTVIVGKAEESKHVIFVDEVYKKCIFKDTIVTKLEINECIEEKSDFVFVDVNDSENDGFLEDPIEGYCEAYECFECHKVFKCRSYLKNHLAIHHQHDFRCDVCGKSFARQSNLTGHLKKHFHWMNDFLECAHCEQKFYTKNKLKRHLNKMHFSKSAQCPKCLKHYRNRAVMRIHLLRHAEPKYECSECTKTFYRRSDMNEHFHVRHTDEHPFVCASCGFMFRTKTSLAVHNSRACKMPEQFRRQTKIQARSGSQLMCRCCSKHCSDTKTLKYHYRAHHPEVDFKDIDILICNKCCLQFEDIAAMQDHADTHAKLECTLCKNLFISEQSLKQHLLTHSKKERPFTCELCQATFVRKYNLSAHMRRRHTLERPPIACELCDTRFMEKSEQRSHQRRVHDKIKPFKCTMCDMAFTTPSLLRNHTIRHTGTGHKYPCDLCDEKFYSAKHLSAHVSRYHT